MKILSMAFLGNEVADWAIAATLWLVIAVALIIGRHWLLRRLRGSQQTAPAGRPWRRWALALLEQTRYPFLLLVALLFGMQYLELSERAARLLDRGTMVVFLLQVALWGNQLVALWLAHSLSHRDDGDAAGAMSTAIIGFIARLGLWSILCLMILDNLGVNITALVASLGIGGVAVALALQNVLGDVFASLSIVLDKPFVIGDFIIVDDIMGTVEYVGLKTTRLRSLGGEQIVFSNTDLLGSRIRNYKRMYERRVVFGIGVTYDTPRAKLEQIPPAIRRIIEGIPRTRFERAHFNAFGDFSLNFEVVYHVQDPDYTRYMDIQQQINLELHEWCTSEGIEFAFPTSTVILQRPAAPALPAS